MRVRHVELLRYDPPLGSTRKGKSKGCAIVTFHDKNSVRAAIAMSGHMIRGTQSLHLSRRLNQSYMNQADIYLSGRPIRIREDKAQGVGVYFSNLSFNLNKQVFISKISPIDTFTHSLILLW